MVFRVEIVWIELADPLEHSAILVVHEVIVFALAMRRVERMIANHVERFVGQMILDDLIKIFVVAPGHAGRCRGRNLLRKRQARFEIPDFFCRGCRRKIAGKQFCRKTRNRAGKCRPRQPIAVRPKAKNFAEVMNQASQDKPTRMAVVANLFGSLEQDAPAATDRCRDPSSTSVLRYSIASQTFICCGYSGREIRFASAATNRTIECV